jgi:hypothetical protein
LFLKKFHNQVLRAKFARILQDLGFGGTEAGASISQQVSGLLNHQLYSFDYLRVGE